MKGFSFSATVCDSLYLLDMEGEIEEIVSKEFQISDQVNFFFGRLSGSGKWPNQQIKEHLSGKY